MSILLPARLAEGIAQGTITVAFRRWKRVGVRPGHVYRTPAGRIRVEAVDEIDPTHIGDADAVRAGYADAAGVRRNLRPADAPVYRIAFRAAEGPDPRAVLAADDQLDDAGITEIDQRLARLDRASRRGPWTGAVLEQIARRPGERAGDLAAECGVDRAVFKRRVRKLKELGLTESLRTGYRLSPRGGAYQAARRGARPDQVG